MASFASSLSPVPSFPEYTGPYKVGTVDVEIPVSELSSPSPAPDGAAEIPTVLFRVFYPAVPESRGKRVSWLPAPQRLHIAAYAQFLGAGNTLASIFSFLPRHLHWTSIPAHKNATLLSPPSDRPRARWPTMIFSHGLGGNRNAYSHLAGSLASYGVVVVCPEHRDGSAALSLVRDPKSQNHHKRTQHAVPYIRIPHTQTSETWEARNRQLRIRLWELGLVFEALSALDRGGGTLASCNLNHSTPAPALAQFTNALDILEPGRVLFSGHSFGAVTVVQLLKSTFYAAHPSLQEAEATPLFTPSPTSRLTKQITPHNPTILLDMWCFPLLSASTAPLYNLPLPCYHYSPCSSSSSGGGGDGPGGSALLAIESAAFFKWTDHLHAKARILSPDPAAEGPVTPALFVRRRPLARSADDDDDSGGGGGGEGDELMTIRRPHFFYVPSSAHLNQSDFGLLFPWLTRRVFKSDRPERVLRLNVRAQLQFLRENGVVVAATGRADLVDGPSPSSPPLAAGGAGAGADSDWDEAILQPGGGGDGERSKVEAWEWIDVVGLGGDSYPSELDMVRREKGDQEVSSEEGEEEMQGEIEPSLGNVVEGAAVGGGK
ncbi:platelet-activating factor acetylhydrolase, isoform II-domain-containing protein [Chaetomidium leptoderma]|uniref:Putative phospholipase n=1 Tax=Chaetomidium leptoderma TaxID=669021 RepID=A0AAN6ZZD1_9PEZI|nr:platelet-activating factor acetylhydrolase, isoform II-domain-containing protein [Chaetomidium leptoderma]